MNCLEFRRLTLIDPQDPNSARIEHERTCEKCAKYASQLLRQDDLIREATKVDVPDGFAARILLNQSLQSQSRRPTRRVWLSLAASFLVAVALLPFLLTDNTQQSPDLVVVEPQQNNEFVTAEEPVGSERTVESIQDHLLAHAVAHDIYALPTALKPAMSQPDQIASVLASAGTAMPTNPGNIVYAYPCVVDGELMAHLLMRHNEREYVVYIVPQDNLNEQLFTGQGWSGQFTQVENRYLAVMSKDGTALNSAAESFKKQLNQPLGTGRTI